MAAILPLPALGVDGVDYCVAAIRRVMKMRSAASWITARRFCWNWNTPSPGKRGFNLTSEEIATQLAVKLKAEKIVRGSLVLRFFQPPEGGIIS